MKQILRFAAICAAFGLFAAVCAAQRVAIAGGYGAASVKDETVVEAATFAVETQAQKDETLELTAIERAERQVVAGANYRLCLSVTSKGKPQQATATVFLNLQNEFSLSEWKEGKCSAAASNADTEPADLDTFAGQLQVGKTESVILYFGAESGDYAAFCFLNNSEAGRAVLKVCKNGGQCEFTGEVDYESPCKVKNLEADLSSSGRIVAVKSVRAVGAKPASTAKQVSVKNTVPATATTGLAPEAVVKNLYAAQKTTQGPFFQSKNRAAVDKYFAAPLADLIWNDAVTANGEVGALESDPLYNAQDRQITLFKIGAPEYGEGNSRLADVPVTFKNMGKAETILFRLEQTTGKAWKITDIFYPSNEETESSLKAILSR